VHANNKIEFDHKTGVSFDLQVVMEGAEFFCAGADIKMLEGAESCFKNRRGAVTRLMSPKIASGRESPFRP
jgi:hypothetical protein